VEQKPDRKDLGALTCSPNDETHMQERMKLTIAGGEVAYEG
jgi:hypothetical protein